MRYLAIVVMICILSFPARSQEKAGEPSTVPLFAQKNKWGGSIGLGLLSANSGNYYQGEPGSTGTLTLNYGLADYHELGLGIGSQLPAVTSDFLHMPLFVHYQYWMVKRPFLKVGLNGGYGFAFKDEMNNIREARGGLMVNPFIGIKLNRSEDWAWSIDFGLLYQKLHYQYGDIDIFEWQREIDLQLWRFVLKTTFEI